MERVHIRWSNNNGLKMVGNDNLVDNCLIEDVDWLATLDFPALEIGFGVNFHGNTTTTAAAAAAAATAIATTRQVLRGIRGGTGSVSGGSHERTARDAAQLGTRAGAGAGMGMYPRDTQGEQNRINRTTVRRFGNAGIVTSQLSNEIAYCHVYDGGLVGNDDACVHADNSYTTCVPVPGSAGPHINCTKMWHHNWVHDCREKCMRGDDYTWQLHGHHNVIFNCGLGRTCRSPGYQGPGCDRNQGAAAGWLTKGDYGLLHSSTIFNVDPLGQGALVVTVAGVPGRGGVLANRSNSNSQFFNLVAHTLGRQPHPPSQSNTKLFKAVYQPSTPGPETLGLRDPANFDFRPTSRSPLVGKGVAVAGIVPTRPGGRAPDIGA